HRATARPIAAEASAIPAMVAPLMMMLSACISRTSFDCPQRCVLDPFGIHEIVRGHFHRKHAGHTLGLSVHFNDFAKDRQRTPVEDHKSKSGRPACTR